MHKLAIVKPFNDKIIDILWTRTKLKVIIEDNTRFHSKDGTEIAEPTGLKV